MLQADLVCSRGGLRPLARSARSNKQTLRGCLFVVCLVIKQTARSLASVDARCARRMLASRRASLGHRGSRWPRTRPPGPPWAPGGGRPEGGASR